jgi:hypothetical protein
VGDYADDAIFAGLDGSWGWGGRGRGYSLVGRRTKRTNQQVFSKFARTPGKFKTGDRVMLKDGDQHGTVMGLRGNQVFWRPDDRQRGGDIFIDADKLLPEL